tara:strand:- start:1261 stop:1959 length:699 start_codon:yes stop_codon:yes gene_type:complete
VCKRLNPEAPVPILDQEYTKEEAGMSSNVKNNLQSLGFKVDHFKNKEHLEKHRLIDLTYKQHLIRYDVGVSSLRSFNVEHLKEDYDIVVISDYNKGFITEEVAEYICELYKYKTVFVDSKKNNLSCFKHCFIKINRNEYLNLKAYNEKNCELIITEGSDGARYKEKNYPTDKVDVYDVCGAGDVFLASLVYGYTKNNDIIESIKIANKFASISVSKLGIYVLTEDDINQVEK